jgi:hypothetical protein
MSKRVIQVVFARAASRACSARLIRKSTRYSRARWLGKSPARRGVASVLAMMFLVIFGSLAAAMAVVAQSNLRTAASGMRLSRAMSAAETGLTFASRRLATETARFVVEKGVIDGVYGDELWQGTYGSGDGAVTIIQPAGYSTGPGIAHAVRDAHIQDNHNIIVESADSVLPEIDQFGTLRVQPIALTAEANGPYFRLTYEIVDPQQTGEESFVRVTSRGYDQDITRTLQMDFKIEKKIEFAILSPNRIMIGKNVLIEGPLGSRYGLVAGELNSANGDPLVMRSDFRYLTDELNAKLDTLYAQVKQYDADGDDRLRPDHAGEAAGLAGYPELADLDGDEYVDDFDLFLGEFDDNSDELVVYDAGLAAEVGYGSLSEEFAGIDDQLARLIDEANADRDGDGDITASDRMLGYRDGIIDAKDQYAKVRGRLAFSVAREPWDIANQDSYQSVVLGPIRPGIEVPPVMFEVTDEEMGEITTDMFAESQAWFSSQVTDTFASQAGTPVAGPPTVTDNWEAVPFGAVEAEGEDFGVKGAYDYYNRPKYVDVEFNNVKIPRGTNALFEDCTFKGVTYIETVIDCDHENWNLCGAVGKDPDDPTNFIVRFPDHDASHSEGNVESDVGSGTKALSNNLRFHNCTFLGSIAGDKPGTEAHTLTHWRNKLQFTGNTRFYIDVNEPELSDPDHPDYQSDAATIVSELNSMNPADIEEMKKSAIFLPGWSIDVGNFTNQQDPDPNLTPKVKLKGTIIAGILDARGTVDVHGTLLMTFRPTIDMGPLFYGGLVDGFNTTIGYFFRDDGDGEGADPDDASFTGFGEITLRYNPDGKLPDGIPWPLRMTAEPKTYVE